MAPIADLIRHEIGETCQCPCDPPTVEYDPENEVIRVTHHAMDGLDPKKPHPSGWGVFDTAQYCGPR